MIVINARSIAEQHAVLSPEVPNMGNPPLGPYLRARGCAAS